MGLKNIKTIMKALKFVDVDDIVPLLNLFDKYSDKAYKALCEKLGVKSVHYRINGKGVTVTWKEGEEKKTMTKSFYGWMKFLA